MRYSFRIFRREIFHVDKESLLSAKLLTHSPNSLLRVINNDTYEELFLVFNRLAPAMLTRNKVETHDCVQMRIRIISLLLSSARLHVSCREYVTRSTDTSWPFSSSSTHIVHKSAGTTHGSDHVIIHRQRDQGLLRAE